MQFSENWLRTWVNPAISSEEMIALFTALGHELDEYTPVADDFCNVRVGKVLAVSPHPDADKLRVCSVKVSADEAELQIVCGASNVRIGLKVAVAMVGAELNGGTVKIKRSRLRGVESEGMLCSASELGLADNSSGILELPDDAPLGEDLRHYLRLDDKSIRLDLTPNRGDCLSIQGLARELALASGQSFASPLAAPFIQVAEHTTPKVFIDDVLSCGRYVGRLISDIDNSVATPLWLKERLRRSGLRSVSPVVDVTNYVMLELGQPLHAFDANTLQGNIHVRKAKAEESLTLLDGKTIALDVDSLVIADDYKALALAGVMGGVESAAQPTTTHLFLESAYFTPLSLAGQARRYGLHTDSSHRFERGVDWQLQALALERATELLLAISGGKAAAMVEVTSTAALPTEAIITLRKSRIARILGIEIPDGRIEMILRGLGMSLDYEKESWRVVVPSFRADVMAEIDLIEEIARVYGYDQITHRYPQQILMPKADHQQQQHILQVSQVLMARAYQELITYSFVDKKKEALLFPDRMPLPLHNPISADLAVMRSSLWQGLLQAVQYNQNRQQDRIRFFEIGKTYTAGADLSSPKEEICVAGVIAGQRWPLQWGLEAQKVDFFDMKGDVEALLQQFKLFEKCTFKRENSPCLHPKQAVAIIYEDHKIGELGALHPRLVPQFGLDGPVFVFELILGALKLATLPRFATLSKYPAIRRDLAFTVSNEVTYERIEAVIRSQKAPFDVAGVRLFDVYQGQGVASGHKSLAVAMLLQHNERTLVDDEVNDWMAKVMNALATELAAALRN
ncbi:MAG: phenylalanyl-tRNA ligase subunit beta [Gammaproteobacteria bacterium]|jgi:phenylalanyl-tRNA synthetase beta chain|nr:phenylalanyl-tRNA ligase subunit beta [Gammaproteobacteria bacterium]